MEGMYHTAHQSVIWLGLYKYMEFQILPTQLRFQTQSKCELQPTQQPQGGDTSEVTKEDNGGLHQNEREPNMGQFGVSFVAIQEHPYCSNW